MDIPRSINRPIQFLFWQVDEIYPGSLGLLYGIWFDQLLIGLGVGFVITRLYRWFRDRHPDGHLSHFLYWHGFYWEGPKTLPNPYVKRFYPSRQ